MSSRKQQRRVSRHSSSNISSNSNTCSNNSNLNTKRAMRFTLRGMVMLVPLNRQLVSIGRICLRSITQTTPQPMVGPELPQKEVAEQSQTTAASRWPFRSKTASKIPNSATKVGSYQAQGKTHRPALAKLMVEAAQAKPMGAARTRSRTWMEQLLSISTR